jgi:hypothetical protein
MKKIFPYAPAMMALLLAACDSAKKQGVSTRQEEPRSLVEIAKDAGKERLIYDAQGNVVEMDLRGLLISDAFVEGLRADDLRHLQVVKLSGEFITDDTVNRLHGQPINLRRIVFEGTSIRDPENHPWVRQLREDTGTELVFIGRPNSEQDGTGQPATRPESKSEGGDKPQPESEGRSR